MKISVYLQRCDLVFLKKLEYYKGILMLTTNRIGKLDPAMSSRIHIILHYKRLGPPEIERIFRTNIERLQESEQQQYQASGERPLFIVEADVMKFAFEHCNKHPKGKGAWNGRQIRNAFLVAAALARQEAEQPGLDASSGFQPQLRSSHFQEVEKLIEEYHSFRAHVLGGDDSRRARLNEERDDDYEGETSYLYSGSDDGRGAGIVNRIRHVQAQLYPHQHMDANRNVSLAGRRQQRQPEFQHSTHWPQANRPVDFVQQQPLHQQIPTNLSNGQPHQDPRSGPNLSPDRSGQQYNNVPDPQA